MKEEQLVIYVDDDPDDREIMQESFDALDSFRLLSFVNGKEFLEYLNKRQLPLPCMVILDINMPFFSGVDILRIMKSDPLHKMLPVAMFTTSKSPMDELQCKQYGAVAIFIKPASFKEAVAVSQKLIQYCE
ncbi:MAG: response regulator receiver protein [Flaviaesturariibacter sp.]|nr:response regulator receiver protein [Flaviaesturariibacter sp.]